LRLDAQSGRPAYVARFAAERQPRGIAIDPSGRWLVAAGEKSDKLSVFGIDRESGHLQLHERYPVGCGANWVEIVDLA
jgi:6-phosphogluconolactonase